MICKALIAVTAAMIYDGDTVSIPGPQPSVRLESMDFEFDTPEIGNGDGSHDRAW